MRKSLTFWNALFFVAVTAITSFCVQLQAHEPNVERSSDEKIAVISVGDLDTESNAQGTEKPTYWLGVRGRSLESAVLRTHLQLAEDMGVVVEEVVPDSPAAKAGLREHDILLRCNGDAIHSMEVLQSQVRLSHEKPIKVKIIRLGKQQELVVAPELRPKSLNGELSWLNGRMLGGRWEQLGLREQLEQPFLDSFNARNIGGFNIRNIGGSMILGGPPMGIDMNQLPNGTSITIQRNNDKPAQITVKKGGKTWEITGDDTKAIEKLPKELRPMIQQMLKNPGHGMRKLFAGEFVHGDLEVELLELLPEVAGGIRRHLTPNRHRGDSMTERVNRLEQEIEFLRDQIEQSIEMTETGP